jgi:GTPase SAR1 family protein
VIVYDVTNRATFEVVEKFRNQILQDLDVSAAPMILVGNKCDLTTTREVATMEGAELAKSWGASFIETRFAHTSDFR